MKLKDLLKLMPATDRIFVRFEGRLRPVFDGCCCDLRATLDEETKTMFLESFVVGVFQCYDHAPYLSINVAEQETE